MARWHVSVRFLLLFYLRSFFEDYHPPWGHDADSAANGCTLIFHRHRSDLLQISDWCDSIGRTRSSPSTVPCGAAWIDLPPSPISECNAPARFRTFAYFSTISSNRPVLRPVNTIPSWESALDAYTLQETLAFACGIEFSPIDRAW